MTQPTDAPLARRGGDSIGVTIEALFARHDLTLLGAAHTAFVFSPPDRTDLAIKVGLDPDDGWPAWAGWCMGHPGPHVPRVFDLQWFRLGGRRRLFVASVERLHRTLVGSRWIRACPTGKRDPLALADHIAANHPGVADVLREAARTFPTGHFDLGGCNWLERDDGAVVLNDPLSRA